MKVTAATIPTALSLFFLVSCADMGSLQESLTVFEAMNDPNRDLTSAEVRYYAKIRTAEFQRLRAKGYSITDAGILADRYIAKHPYQERSR
jgi:hypothetical protein